VSLPFVDAHSVEVAADPAAAWDAAAGTVTPGRFWRVARSERPSVVCFEGEHPFARYRLTFRVEERGRRSTLVTAETHAAFPGPHGTLYRLAVIGTRFHVLAVRRMLGGIRRRAETGG
jgi:hypothetical protein